MQPEDQGKVLEQYRPVLRMLAGARLDLRLRSRVDPSDLVQESLLKAHANLKQFRGTTVAELQAWVRRILANEMALAHRRFVDGPRGLEQSLEAGIEETSCRLEHWLVDLSSGPVERAQRSEQLLRLMEALRRLPEEQRNAVELRYLQGLTPPQIAALENKTVAAVAGLLRRALGALRQALEEES